MYSRRGIEVYRRGAAIYRVWRPAEIVNKTTTVAACFHRSSSSSSSTPLDALFPRHEDFSKRHIGPNGQEQSAMLEYLGLEVRISIRSQGQKQVGLYAFSRAGRMACQIQRRNWFGLVLCFVTDTSCAQFQEQLT